MPVIHQIASEQVDMRLLLEADPDEKTVREYLQQSIIFEMKEGSQSIGCLLLLQDSALAEIKNIAIAEAYRGKGYGSLLLQFAIAQARRLGAKRLKIATGNSSIGQIYLYQKAGFELSHVVRDHFTDHYPEPILENGIPCKHQLVFEMQL